MPGAARDRPAHPRRGIADGDTRLRLYSLIMYKMLLAFSLAAFLKLVDEYVLTHYGSKLPAESSHR